MKPEKNKEEEQDFLSLLAEKGGFAPIKHNHKEIDVIDLDRIRWKGKFTKGQEYKVNDLVSYQGNLYICMTDNKGQVPTTNFWELLTVINDKDSIRKGDAISLLKNDKNYITELMFMSSPLSKFRNDIGFITKEDIDWQSNVPSNEKDPIFLKHPAYTITRLDIDSWNNGLAKLRNIKIDFIGGGGGGSGGGVTTETDPIFTASPAHGIDAFDIANWNTAYGWGNHAGLYELTGTASGLIGTHESTYDHTLIATALQSLDGAWLNDTNQTDLTGDKSGSFDVTTTGDVTASDLITTEVKSKTILGTDANGKIIEGTHQDISGKENVGVAARLDSNHLSAFNHGDIAHTNRTALNNVSGVNTGDQTSIKKTWSFGRTWTTGDSSCIKTKQVFLANSSFVRVYKDSVLLTYTTDWSFNTTAGKKIGSVSDLTDGIILVSPTNGSVYLVEFDEYLVPFSPVIGLCRSDGKMPNKGLPRNTIADNGRSGLISNIEYDEENKEYTVTYAKTGGGTFTLMRRYADRAFCANFDFNKALPTGWRIELYKIGRHWSGRRASAPTDDYTTMNSTLSPRKTYTTNIIDLGFLFDKKRSGEVKIRLRNTTTNEVSNFSFQTIKSRQFKYVNRSWAGFGARINKITLD